MANAFAVDIPPNDLAAGVDGVARGALVRARARAGSVEGGKNLRSQRGCEAQSRDCSSPYGC
jgi:hypothetical protein